MKKYTFKAEITVEGGGIRNKKDAIRELQVMLDDYYYNNKHTEEAAEDISIHFL